MNLKEKVEKRLLEEGVKEYKIIYKKESTYQKRFKPDFREEEVWLYPITGTEEYTLKGRTLKTNGLLIRENDTKDKECFDFIIEAFKYSLSISK